MKRHLFIPALVLSIIASCSNNEDSNNVLLEGLTAPQENHPQWSTLFTENLVVTPLETSDESLIGRIDKIVKFKGDYYICSSSGRHIHHFNSNGKFISSLKRQGAGPEEYHRIEDFDVYEVNGKIEVWLSDNQSLKIYDASDFSFKYKIPYTFMIHKFKRIDKSRILLVTGMNEHILTLSDEHGNKISEYLEKEIPFLMFRPIQFISFESSYLFQLGVANAYIAYNPDTNSFQEGVFSKEKKFLPEKELLLLFKKHGTDFIGKANERIYINNLITSNGNVWILSNNNKIGYLTKYKRGEMLSTEINYGSIISSISMGDSDESLLLYATPDQILECEDELLDKYKNKTTFNSEDNPYVLEFF